MLTRFLGSRGASAVISFFMLALASSGATAQTAPAAISATANATLVQPTAAAKFLHNAVATVTGMVLKTPAVQSVNGVGLAPAIAKEAAWLYRAGWPLMPWSTVMAPARRSTNNLLCRHRGYFEARGESLEEPARGCARWS